MSKPQAPRKVASTEAIATLKGVKGSVQKAQLVLGLIRGKKVEQAMNDLRFCRKRLAESALKVLQSAVANAEMNHQLNVDKLVVAHAYADKGMVLRRFNARARGRSASIQKPRCHLTVVVAEKVAAPKAAPKAKSTQPAETKTEKTEA